MELHHASRQWATRPDDQRFTSLHQLHEVCALSKHNSRAKAVSSKQFEVQPHPEDPIKGIQIVGQNGTPAILTHHSFNQLSQLAQAPAGYMRKLPAPLVADAMNYGLRFLRQPEDVGVLLTQREDVTYSEPGPVEIGSKALTGDILRKPFIELRAATGPNYGRIWNSDITKSLISRFGDGVTGDWKVPGEFGKDVVVTKDNTTIYGSDRDMFVFLADEKNRVDVANRRNGQPGTLARGFFIWNSEVGDKSMGAAFFLFDYACSNRIVWGAREFKEIRLRHTVSAPDKWLAEITPVLTQYANAAAAPVEQTIKAAQEKRIGDDLDKFLRNRFTVAQAEQIKQAHVREEGRPIETLWDVTTATTAFAKNIRFTDDRVAIERKAGAILDLVAA